MIWSPDQLILDGKPCSLDDLRSKLADIRHEVDAEDLLLIAEGRNTLLRSLCLSTSATSIGRDLSNHLKGERLVELKGVDFLRTLATGTLTHSDVKSLSQLSPFEPLDQVRDWTIQLSRHGSSRAGGLTASLLVLAGSRKVPADKVSSGTRELAVMVNSTSEAGVYRDTALTREIASLRVIDDVGGVKRFLDLLARRLGVDGAAWYDINPRSDELRLVTHSEGPLDPAPIVSLEARSAVAVAAFQEHQPIVLMKGLSAFGHKPTERKLESTWKQSIGGPVAEAAIPIPSGPFGERVRYSGVLSVASRDFSAQFIGPYELSLLRNATLRLALYSAQRDSNGAALALASYIASAPSGRTRAKFIELPPKERQASIPEDIYSLKSQLEALAAEVAKATGSDTVVFRVLVCDAVGAGTFYRLKRLAVFPQDTEFDEHDLVRLDTNCVTAWVARTGTPCNLSNIDDPRTFDPYPGLTKTIRVPNRESKSELCLPIFADGRLLGTLNLESRQKYAFQHTVGIATAFAAEAGSLLERHRAAIAESVLSLASRLHRDSHYFLQLTEELARMAKESESRRASSKLRRIRSVLTGLTSRERIQKSVHLTSLIEKSLQKQPIEYIWRDQPREDVVISRQDSIRIGAAFADIFVGVRAHKAVGEPIILSSHNVRLGGRLYTDIIVSERTQALMSLTLEDKLYRAPVARPNERDGRPHLGSYTAGALLRSIGGDARIRICDRLGRYVKIIASIPVLEHSHTDGGV